MASLSRNFRTSLRKAMRDDGRSERKMPTAEEFEEAVAKLNAVTGEPQSINPGANGCKHNVECKVTRQCFDAGDGDGRSA